MAYPGTSVATLGDAIGLVYGNNNKDPNNTINLWGPGTYTISNESIVHYSKTLTIAGHGAGAVISAAGKGYVFSVNATVKFEDLAITGGAAQVQSNSSPPVGAGLNVVGGQVTLSNVAVRSNVVSGANGPGLVNGMAAAGQRAVGAGIYVAGGSLTLLNSTVSNNRALAGAGRTAGGDRAACRAAASAGWPRAAVCMSHPGRS